MGKKVPSVNKRKELFYISTWPSVTKYIDAACLAFFVFSDWGTTVMQFILAIDLQKVDSMLK